jgi:exodeoxyribonuclease-5
MCAEVILTSEQQTAVDRAVDTIIAGKWLYAIGGYAGTGKTTVSKSIVEQAPAAISCAFTGKAAYRLRQKGVADTQTIHRAIYNYDPEEKKFLLKQEVNGRYFLIDEGSMISTDLWQDISSFGLPVILLGDPGQLPPVGRDPCLMHNPDIVLEQIHRQAAGSGIIQFASNIRLRTHRPDMQYKDVTINRDRRPTFDEMLKADIVLCGFNPTRARINKRIRKHNGYTEELCPGERLVILRNNFDFGVFNGQLVTVRDILEKSQLCITVRVETDDSEILELPLIREQFGKFCTLTGDFRKYVLADYGYCLTVHKSQGSEWDSVLVIDEQCEYWSASRWRYTAITRAAKELKYYVGE